MKFSLLSFIILCCFACQTPPSLPEVIAIEMHWQFKQATDTVWKPASVPGNVFSDLLNNELIEDPFLGNNEENLQWVSQANWEYKTTFSISKRVLNRKHLELNFDGLDTYASVFLNDSLILKTANAFRNYSVDVKPLLKNSNELKIVFEAASKQEGIEKAKQPYTLPEGNRIFTRKAQFQYGWDWAPKLNTMGIWRPIKLQAWDNYHINNVTITQHTLTDSIADLVVTIESEMEGNPSLEYTILVNDSLVYNRQKGNPLLPEIFTVQIRNPKRWWPHNLGEPHLYDVKIVVKDGDRILDSTSTKMGLRTIKLVTEKDSIGQSFYFKVNGIPVYAKGANYIPQHSFQDKVSKADYEKLLDAAVLANMNMLRVWGGGIYENDVFYELCDEKGIMVWQDFMFACAMYPSDVAFLENVKQEAIYNVKRLQNHPSIALWCGNNENSEGWHRWGWQDGRGDDEKEKIWKGYLKVFDSILPNAVRQFSEVDYWESSPKFGRGNPRYELEGDAHDWWVWHDGYPFEHFQEHVPRFMSEFGFQSFPSTEVAKFINQNETLNFDSEAFKNHQKHNRGFQLIHDYMERDFPVPSNPEDYIYMSQLLQAYGVCKGIEAQRRAKPKTMGSLYWQLNDCWPAVSWSSIDFFGNWKALHYQAKKAFDNVLITFEANNDQLELYLVNDTMTSISGSLETKIMDFNGEDLFFDKHEIVLKPNSSEIKQRLHLEHLPKDRSNLVVVSRFNEKEALYYFESPKNLKLQKGEITKTITKTNKGFLLKLQSNTLQKSVYLTTETKGFFSDNYFDIVPNKMYEVEFITEQTELNSVHIKTLNNFIRF